MKNLYQTPILEYVTMAETDVIATSLVEVGLDDDADGKYGTVQPIYYGG